MRSPSKSPATFWETGSREYEDRVEAIALQRLLPPRGEILLEAGAGAGRNTPRYQGFARLVLLDYSISQLRLAQERLGKDPRYTYVAADIYRLPFVPGLFDATTMIRTLHHMADAPRALRQIRQAMQSGAIFILEFANKQNLKAILRYVLRRQSWSPFSPEPVEFAKLNFDFHPKTVRLWLSQSQFAIERQLTVSHFRIGLLKRLLPLKLLVSMDALAQQTGDWWQLTPSVFVRCHATGEPQKDVSGAIFRCPECEYFPLVQNGPLLSCTACGRQWGIQDGIYDFRRPVE
jgi:ubiquinone/menaquinone biosynthesis C-methylase UbiE